MLRYDVVASDEGNRAAADSADLIDLPVVPICRNRPALISPPNHRHLSAHPVPQEGRIMIVTDVGAGCGGRGGVDNERRWRGRRSRVVLTPRRWRQALAKARG